MNKNKKLSFFFCVFALISLITGCNTDEPSSAGTVKDIDGNVYHTVTIGTQTWMVENLKVTKYRNGDPIPNVTDATAWGNLSTGAWCNYNNDATNNTKYGKLYNWYAVFDSRNIAPVGWHVPTDAEWTTLTDYVAAHLGTSISVAKALAATTDWTTSTTDGAIGNNLSINNSSGFSAFPGGYRAINGTFLLVGNDGFWWRSEGGYTDTAWYRHMSCKSGGVWVSGNYGNGKSSFSVRCVKD